MPDYRPSQNRTYVAGMHGRHDETFRATTGYGAHIWSSVNVSFIGSWLTSGDIRLIESGIAARQPARGLAWSCVCERMGSASIGRSKGTPDAASEENRSAFRLARHPHSFPFPCGIAGATRDAYR